MHVELTRTLRFALAHTGSLPADVPKHNTFAAWPPLDDMSRYFQLHLTCRGPIDPDTGFFLNITHIDQLARSLAFPLVARAAQSPQPNLSLLLRQLFDALLPALDRTLIHLALQLSPATSLQLRYTDMPVILLAQQYEFSAAHRLHNPRLSPGENQRIFGKCNNPSGHGHNYRLEVVVQSPPDALALPISRLDALVNQHVIELLDHKHLNVDVSQFQGLNPTVENIATVIYNLLTQPLSRENLPLDHVTVWETAKTSCTYRG